MDVGDLACAFALLMDLEDRSRAERRRRVGSLHSDWSDVMAFKAGREVLMGVQYPDDATRRSLYATWLRVFALGIWQEDFDSLMLGCVAATPSPSNPGTPLFADMFRVDDPVDRCPPKGFVLNVSRLPTMFTCKTKSVEPLPESSAFFRFVADLIRKGSTSREALDEAGMIIGFCSLAMAVVVAKSPRKVQDFFAAQMKRALSAAVPTTFDGDIPCPKGRFLAALTRKALSTDGVVKPYIVLLAVGQYICHVKAKEAAPSADVKFLVEAFLTPAKFGHLEVVELFSDVQDQVGLVPSKLSHILAEGAPAAVSLSSQRVSVFLEQAGQPMQQSLPWCRAASCCFFPELGLSENMDFALRLMAFLAPDPDDQRWKRREFATACESSVREARLWARDFKRALRKGKYGDLPKWQP